MLSYFKKIINFIIKYKNKIHAIVNVFYIFAVLLLIINKNSLTLVLATISLFVFITIMISFLIYNFRKFKKEEKEQDRLFEESRKKFEEKIRQQQTNNYYTQNILQKDKERIKKLYYMSTMGDAGEKDVAKVKLNRLLNKLNLKQETLKYII